MGIQSWCQSPNDTVDLGLIIVPAPLRKVTTAARSHDCGHTAQLAQRLNNHSLLTKSVFYFT